MRSPDLAIRGSTAKLLEKAGIDSVRLDSSSEALAVIDRGGVIVLANARAVGLLAAEAVEGRPITDFVQRASEGDGRGNDDVFFQVSAPSFFGPENGFVVSNASGRQLKVEMLVSPIGRGELAYVLLKPIGGVQPPLHSGGQQTELQQLLNERTELLEQRTRELEEQSAALSLIVDSMGDGVVVVDMEGAFKLFNLSARKLLDHGPVNRPPKEWPRLYGTYLSDRETLLTQDQLPLIRALRGEQIENYPIFLRNSNYPDGLYISVNAQPIHDKTGVITGAVAVFRNVSEQKRTEDELREAREELERRVVERTLSLARANRELNMEIEERRQAEMALKASERQLRLMADSLPIFVAYVDARQRFLFTNAAYNEWFGLQDGDVRGKPVWEVIGIERYKVLRSSIEQALSGRTVVTDLEIPHQELGIRQIQMNLVPDRDDAGAVQGFYAVGLDTTERHETEVMERKHREELAHVSRVTTMGELTAALAHELNQPLTSIRSNAQAAVRLMGQNEIDQSELKEILDDIISDNRRASEVIRRLRAMLRKRPMTLETLSVVEVVEETVSMVKNDSIMRGVKMEVRMADDLPAIRADRIQLQQVLLNLIMNGFEAMREVKEIEEKLLVIRSMVTSEGDVCICVSDQGPGLKGGVDSQAMFQPFYSTKDEGMGMGLSISRSIIDAMGGRIWAVNNNDRGATFHFTIPVAE